MSDTAEAITVDPAEIEKFSKIAAEWWDPKGKFRPLHKFNPVRLGYIRDVCAAHFNRDEDAVTPLSGLRLLDVGCGGGLVSEPMRRLGADVTGLDAAERNVKTAATHAEEQGLTIDYRSTTVETLAAEEPGAFDIVLNLEVVEHVADVGVFLKASAALVKPGGIMILATINRTLKALATAKIGAEYILRWLPAGTHEFSKFVTPGEAAAPLRAAGLEVAPAQGVSYVPLADKWRLSGDTAVNYMLKAVKPADTAI
ncbi:MAG: bifunctional 2-polyprenyl-6-hydroxyphenol methylase/3-demethylubiquinol 3-O-methyltransferase UbiG [Pseudomonadota bacterium]